MPKVNFSTENQRVFDLTLDLLRDDYSAHIDKEKLSKKDLENHLRNTINKATVALDSDSSDGSGQSQLKPF